MRHDPIIHADLSEEYSATVELQRATTKDELVSAWNINCEHFQGAARERLQEEFALKVREFGALVG